MPPPPIENLSLKYYRGLDDPRNIFTFRKWAIATFVQTECQTLVRVSKIPSYARFDFPQPIHKWLKFSKISTILFYILLQIYI